MPIGRLLSSYGILSRDFMITMGGWLAGAAISCISVFNCQLDPSPIKIGHSLFAAVIIPVRGIPEHFKALWQGQCAQSYRSFRIIFSVEGDAYPVYPVLKSLAGGPPTQIVVAVQRRNEARRSKTFSRRWRNCNLAMRLLFLQMPTLYPLVFAQFQRGRQPWGRK
jgi:hypothetical protein